MSAFLPLRGFADVMDSLHRRGRREASEAAVLDGFPGAPRKHIFTRLVRGILRMSILSYMFMLPPHVLFNTLFSKKYIETP